MGIEPFIGQIQPFAGSFAPRGWAFCLGQLLPIAQYTAVFSILGDRYGGDGRVNFALPDLRGRAVLGAGNAPGLSSHPLGLSGGVDAVALNAQSLATHTHAAGATGTLQCNALSTAGTHAAPTNGDMLAASYNKDFSAAISWYVPSSTNLVPLAGVGAQAGGPYVQGTGGSEAHSNLQPFTSINYIIALEGVYPPRS